MSENTNFVFLCFERSCPHRCWHKVCFFSCVSNSVSLFLKTGSRVRNLQKPNSPEPYNPPAYSWSSNCTSSSRFRSVCSYSREQTCYCALRAVCSDTNCDSVRVPVAPAGSRHQTVKNGNGLSEIRIPRTATVLFTGEEPVSLTVP